LLSARLWLLHGTLQTSSQDVFFVGFLEPESATCLRAGGLFGKDLLSVAESHFGRLHGASCESTGAENGIDGQLCLAARARTCKFFAGTISMNLLIPFASDA